MNIISLLLAFVIFPAMALETPPTTKNSLGTSVSAQLQTPNKGKVLNIIVSGNFTYIEVADGGKSVWLAAVNISPVNKGETINYGDGPVMVNFYSKNLKRSFDKIIFVSKISTIK